jgi:small subunit ribosomal protein S4
MARYIGPTCKLARREGADLSLKSPARRAGQEVQARAEARSAWRREEGQELSDYSVQLREKQKVKRMYGMLERQFRNGITRRPAVPKGATGENLLRMLEVAWTTSCIAWASR